MCHDKPDNHLIPNLEDCKSFYICRDKVAIPETCSTSFWFDPTRMVCALPGPYCSELVCLGSTSVFAADPFECGVYHFCSAESILYSGACNHDLSFVASSQSCTYPHCWEIEAKKEADTLPADTIEADVLDKPYYSMEDEDTEE